MRLKILDDQAQLIRERVSRISSASTHFEISGSIVLMSYRRDLFGKQMAECFHEGMRASTEWSIGEVELFAAFVSSLNKCKY